MRPILGPVMRHIEGGEDVDFALQPFPCDQSSSGERGKAHLNRLGSEALQLCVGRRWRLAVGTLQAHLRERVDYRKFAGIASGSDVPGTAASFHGVVDGGASLAPVLADHQL